MNPLQLFNPSNQPRTELIANFSIRLKEYNRIKKEIESDEMLHAPQHYIIQGVRGSGKTTLLWRLYYEIKKSKKASLVPIIFNEEQYGLNKLFKLWEQIAKELESESNSYLNLLDHIQSTDEVEQYEEHSYTQLFNALSKNGNKICLFWDNIGEFLQKLTKKEQQRLREVLITNDQIRIVGASSEVLESTYKYDEPFYEYFKIIHLKELNKEETIQFLLALDQINNTNKIAQIVKETPGRIEALRIITGGIPRTMVLLYEIFINDNNGDSFKYLEILLDRVTPLYKHRMDDLSTQQQEIVDCIALNWDAIAVKEIAKKTRMESKSISAQLRLLEKNNVILKKGTSTKNHFYQVKERFFNIWYIMRNGHKSDRNKVKWLTKFLELWCDKNSLNEMINTHISKLQSGKVYDKYALDLTEAFAQIVTSYELQHQLLNETKSYFRSSGSGLLREVSDSDQDFISNKIKPLIQDKKYENAISILERKESNTGFMELHIAMIYSEFLDNKNEAKSFYLKAIEKGEKTSMNNLAIIYSLDFDDNIMAEKYFKLAIESGYDDSTYNLASFYHKVLKKTKDAEKYYLLAINKGSNQAMNGLANLYFYELGKAIKAKEFYLLAIKSGNKDALFNIGLLFQREFKEYNKAEEYYKLSKESGYVFAINNLGFLYQNFLNRPKEAEEEYLTAIEKGNKEAITNLATLYQNEYGSFKKAEKYFKLAIEEGEIYAYGNLALLYQKDIKQFRKAEKFYQLALDNGDLSVLNNFGVLYNNEFDDIENAIKYYELAIENEDVNSMNNLGVLYQNKLQDNIRAEKFYKMAIIKNNEKAMNNLAFLYFEQGLKKEEAHKLSKQAFLIDEDYSIRHTYASILLWNNKIEAALKVISPLFERAIILDKPLKDFELVISLLIAKKQYNYVFQLFNENQNNLKDRFKPIYYALMHFMKDTYPDEIKKMGEELNETVENIVEYILELREKYK